MIHINPTHVDLSHFSLSFDLKEDESDLVGNESTLNLTEKNLVAKFLSRKMTRKMTRSRMNENPKN